MRTDEEADGTGRCGLVEPATAAVIRGWQIDTIPGRIGFLIPNVRKYECITRILHPDSDVEPPRRWWKLAAARGVELKAETQFSELVGEPDRSDMSLHYEPYLAVVRALVGQARSAPCVIALSSVITSWGIYGARKGSATWEAAAEWEHPPGWPQPFRLFTGDLIQLVERASDILMFEPPNLAVCDELGFAIANGLDLDSTVVASDPEMQARLLAIPTIEAIPARHDMTLGVGFE